MPFIDDDPTLEEDNRHIVLQRLDKLMADPVRQEFGDPELVDYIDRQRDRLTDASGAPVRSDFEPFRPAVQRSDIRLESPVGEGEANHPLAVFNTKKLLNKAGFHAFAPGIEEMGEASPRFLADLKRFQRAHDLEPDATVEPGGPTVHMLTRKVFGLADGPPPESESEHFEERFGTDPNRTLSGQPIFGAERTDGDGTELTPAGFKFGRWRWKRPKLPGRPRPNREPPRKKKRHQHESRESPHPKEKYPVVVDRPAFIYRYPDGRLYASIRPNGDIGTSSKRGSVYFHPLDTDFMIEQLRKGLAGRRYPRLDDKRSFEERHAAGEEVYVRGEVVDEHGFPIAYTILIDPDSGQPLRAPVGKDIYLTMDQIKKLGLTRWHQPHRRSR